jgi:hypothetical protein
MATSIHPIKVESPISITCAGRSGRVTTLLIVDNDVEVYQSDSEMCLRHFKDLKYRGEMFMAASHHLISSIQHST